MADLECAVSEPMNKQAAWNATKFLLGMALIFGAYLGLVAYFGLVFLAVSFLLFCLSFIWIGVYEEFKREGE